MTAFIVALCLPNLLVAQSFFANGQCAIVLASKPSATLAIEEAKSRFRDKDVTIYRSKNGWYATTWSVLEISGSKQTLQRLKAAGEIPQDALCSRGRSYVSRVTTVRAQSASKTPVPFDLESSLLAPLNANLLTRAEKRFLQLALAFEGDYVGLLDGDWGKISNRAMRAFSAREFGSNALNLHMTALAGRVFTLFERDGWAMMQNEPLGMSYLFPFKAFREGTVSSEFVNFEHQNSSLGISLSRGGQAQANALHRFTVSSHRGPTPVYSVRKSNYAVTSISKADRSLLYVRSHFIRGAWSSVVVSAAARDIKIFRGVTSSIAQGAVRDLNYESNGYLNANIEATLAILAQDDNKLDKTPPYQHAELPPSSSERPKRDQRQSSKPKLLATGSGFVVGKDGTVLTNEHVTEGCTRLEIDGKVARVAASNTTFDLAVLTFESDVDQTVANFAPTPAGLNADITVVGFPLNSMLGGLNVTRGAISAQVGLRGDGTQMQISAPVQPGNSGGPVLDKTGSVVGVVVSRLRSRLLDNDQLDVPQNVNFAIRAEIAKLFLYQNNVVPQIAPDSLPDLNQKILRAKRVGIRS